MTNWLSLAMMPLQFALFLNALCWIHAERHFRKFIPVADQIRLELEQVCDAIWNLYHELKEYKRDPKAQQKEAQEARGVLPVEELEKPLQVLRKPVVSKKYHFGNTCKAGWVVLEKSLHLLPL